MTDLTSTQDAPPAGVLSPHPPSAVADGVLRSETLVFCHANGYPPGAYQPLLGALAEKLTVHALEHRPLWLGEPAPRVLSWQTYASDLIAVVEREMIEPVWIAGHSMGAVTALLAAERRPELFKGIVALDPVLLRLKIWLIARFATGLLRQDPPMVKRALTRPHSFQGYDAAFQFYRGKRAFQRMSDDALWDYVHAGHAEQPGGGVALRWSGAWEACVYRSAPYMFNRLPSIELPLLGIAGDQSDVLTPEAIADWQRAMPEATILTQPGGHLIPMEAPAACAEAILEFVEGA